MKYEKCSLICQVLFFAGGGWSIVEERNSSKTPSLESEITGKYGSIGKWIRPETAMER
jgi:hypothetical protein